MGFRVKYRRWEHGAKAWTSKIIRGAKMGRKADKTTADTWKITRTNRTKQKAGGEFRANVKVDSETVEQVWKGAN